MNFTRIFLLALGFILFASASARAQTPTVTTGAATAVKDLTATLTGTANANGGSESVYFNYGLTTNYGSFSYPTPGSISGSTTTSVNSALTGLLPSTTYHYVLYTYLSSSGIATYGADMTFTTGAPATPPSVGTVNTTTVTATQTSVYSGGVAAGSSPTTVVFEYGKTAAYGSSVTSSSIIPTSTTAYPGVLLPGLTPQTTYHYRCDATNGQGGVHSADATFTTPGLPVVITGAATSVTDLAATLAGTANAGGAASLSVSFDYGTTTNYGSNIYASSSYVSGSSTITESASPTGLLPATTYHYRLNGIDGLGTAYYGADMSFTTGTAATPPTLGTVASYGVGVTQASLEVTSVSAGSSTATVTFEYGPTTAYGSTATVSSQVATNTTASYPGLFLTGLTPATAYHYRCDAANGQGTARSADATFTTLAVPILTTAAALGVTDLAATLSGTANASGGSLSVYFEYGVDPYYGTSVTASTYNVSGTAAVAETASPTGLLPNTTYHYRLTAYDASGTYYHGADMSFTTKPAATPPSVGAVSSPTVTATQASVKVGTVTAGSSPASVAFEYGPTTAYGSSVTSTSTFQTNTTTSSVSVTLTGLAPAAVYHYRCTAANGEGIAHSADATFTTPALPVLTTSAAAGVTDLAATVNGTANAGGGSLTMGFDYGPTAGYGSTASASALSVSGNTTVGETGNPLGLLPNTTFHFRLRGSDALGTLYFGADMSFTTAAPATPPTVGVVSAYNITATQASVQVTSVTAGSSPATVIFEYGPTTSYGSSVTYSTISTNAKSFNAYVTLPGLAVGTTYHCRCSATNGQGAAHSVDATFTTLAPPLLSTLAPTGVSDLAATLNGTANAGGGYLTVSFDYGATSSYGNTTSASSYSISGSTPVAETASPSGLLPNTSYHYRIKAYDGGGTYYYGSDMAFTTGAAATPPAVGAVSAPIITATQAKVQAINVVAGSSPATVVFEYGTSTAYGATSSYSSIVATNTTAAPVAVTLTGLAPATLHHYRCTATNAQGITHSQDATFTTPAPPLLATNAPTNIGDIAATLNGSANAGGGSLTVSFDYGVTANYGNTAAASTATVSGAATVGESASPAGLLPNSTYHCRIKGVDPLGTSYYGADTSFTMGIPMTPPTIGAVAAYSVTATQATLQVTSVAAGSSQATGIFEYGPTVAYGSTAGQFTVATNTAIYSSVKLTGLTPSTTYHFRCDATNGQGTSNGADATFTTFAQPGLTTGAATGVTDLLATVNGTASAGGGSLNVYFDFGTSTSYGATLYPTPGYVTGGNVAVSANPPGLLPSTTYHYRIYGYDSGNSYYYGADRSFTTGPAATPPVLGTVSSPAVGATQAKLQVSSVAAGSSPATVMFEFGSTAAYGSGATVSSTIPTNTTSNSLSVILAGLMPGATYHYRCDATNAQGTVSSTDATFTTPALPVLTTAAATAISDIGVTLNGTGNAGGGSLTVSFDYGTGTGYGSYVTASPSGFSGSTTVVSSANPSGLLPNTTYHYRIKAYDAIGTYYYGSDMSFVMGAPAALPALGTVSTAATTATRANIQVSNVSAGGSPATVIIEYGPTTAYGVTAVSATTIPTNTSAGAVFVVLTGLTSASTYHYRCDVTNGQGTTDGPDATFTTLTAPVITTSSATGVTDLAATFNGTANANGGSMTVSFDYGTGTGYGSTAAASHPSVSTNGSWAESANPPLLTPNTTYHYRLKGIDFLGTSYYGADMFLTTGNAASPPTIGAVSISSFSPTQVTVLVANVTAGSSPAKLAIEFGPTAAYGAILTYPVAIPAGTMASPLVSLSGLTPGATYHYRCDATNAEGAAYSADATFTTATLPVLTTTAATGVTDLAATLNGTVNAGGGTLTVSFDFGTSTAYGSTVAAVPASVTGNTNIAASANPAGLLPKATYHYRIKATDGAGTSYYGPDMSFTTGTPATLPTVGTVSTSSVGATQASIYVTSMTAGSSAAAVTFEYGPTTAYGSTAAYSSAVPANTTGSYLTVSLSGLMPGTAYHYRCDATNSEGAVRSGDAIFTTLSVPTVSTNPATGVTDLAATLNGTANPGGGSLSASFDYGTTTAYGFTSYSGYLTGANTAAVSGTPSGLLPNTTYHYRAYAYTVDGYDTYYYGGDMTFTTAPASTAPSVSTGAASPVGALSARLAANGIASGSSAAALVFDYGPTASYGFQAGYSQSLAVNSTYSSLSVQITGLLPGTLYHYRPRITNAQGTVYGTDGTFATPGLPVVATGAASGVTDLAATLKGTGNANSGSYAAVFEYGLTSAYGSSINATPPNLGGSVSASLTANPPFLLPKTTYHYRLRLNDGVSSFYGSDATFITNAPGTPPSIATAPASAISATTAFLNASNALSGSSPAAVAFKYGLTASYGSGLPFVTLTTNHPYTSISAGVTGLQPFTTYHFTASATNAQGTASGADLTFTTMGLATATTGAATNVTDLNATLNATVNPAGVASAVSFEYGPTTAYGSTISPSASSVTGMNTVAAIAILQGLTPSATYHFRVRLDNIDGTYYGADGTFTMASPGTPPSIGSLSSRTGATAVTLSANTLAAGSSPASLIFQYGLTAGYGSQVAYSFVLPAGTINTASVTLNGLVPATTYHYRAIVSNNEGTTTGADNTFTTFALPFIATGPATAIADISAVLNGTATAHGGSLTVIFDYGTSLSYGSSVYPNSFSVSGNATANPTASLAYLKPGTTYHYRLKGSDGAGTYYYGADVSFTTAAAATLPTVSTDIASGTATGATLWAASVTSGASAATVSWQYGLSASYGSSLAYGFTIPLGTNWGSAAASVSGLLPTTTYHYRAVITNAQATVYGADATFTTAAVSVSATTLPATRLGASGATLNGSFVSNAAGSALTFDYGLDATYGTSVNGTPAMPSESTASQALSAILAGLTPGATYHYRLVNTNPYGTVYGSDLTFTTALSATLPIAITGTATGSTTGNATFRGTVNGNGYPATPILEYGLTSDYGSIVTALPAQVLAGVNTAVSAAVAGLTTNLTYHYRIDATSSQGTAFGDDAIVQMVQPPVVSTRTPYLYPPLNAELTGYISSPGPVTAYFEYGTTLNYGNTVGIPYYRTYGYVSAFTGAFGYNGPLQPGTTYHYRLVASNAGGTAYGNDVVFTTDYAFSSATYQSVTGLSSTSATLNATVTETGGADAVSFDYGLDSNYGANIPATPATVSGTGAYPASLTLTGLTPGTTYHYRLTAIRYPSGGISTSHFLDQTFTTLTPFENWRQKYFNTTAQTGMAANDANPAGDGISNLMKYALGLDPTVPSAALPQPIAKTYNGATYLSYTFPRNPANTDLTYEVLASDAPAGPWTTIASSIGGGATAGAGFVAETPGTGGLVTVEVHDTVNLTATAQRFLCLRIAQ